MSTVACREQSCRSPQECMESASQTRVHSAVSQITIERLVECVCQHDTVCCSTSLYGTAILSAVQHGTARRSVILCACVSQRPGEGPSGTGDHLQRALPSPQPPACAYHRAYPASRHSQSHPGIPSRMERSSGVEGAAQTVDPSSRIRDRQVRPRQQSRSGSVSRLSQPDGWCHRSRYIHRAQALSPVRLSSLRTPQVRQG
jgi:hypothetical protein